MAAVVFLKGINVGGHRRFRPSLLAQQLRKLEVSSVGAAGTFVVRKAAGEVQLREEFSRCLPFETEVIVCDGRDVLRLVAAEPFHGRRPRADVVMFVTIMARRITKKPRLPLRIPENGEWGLQVLTSDGRFLTGVYRRQMKAIGYLTQLEKVFGVALTTRSWSTMQAVARLLEAGHASPRSQQG